DHWGFHYDPAIAVPFRSAPPAADLWPLYDAITAPTLLLRGAQSDVLAADVASQMQARGPKARRIDFEGVGHAPTLIADDQIDAVDRFGLARSEGAARASSPVPVALRRAAPPASRSSPGRWRGIPPRAGRGRPARCPRPSTGVARRRARTRRGSCRRRSISRT